jgi:hypothetical protein
MSKYELDKNYRNGNTIATAIYYNKDGQVGISKEDDLIAIIKAVAQHLLT